ncbi:hypothetical protein [Haladaptatus caseinilyticus]|uniref:hypothetical protein n=1 Tax=Haladaptatus caseinilyticus TaxID=2993314 RepID=UPI00224B9984|nr:hypothetical protein [Haladaptatus caseinilyticus]
MTRKLRSALVILLAGSILAAGFAGTTAAQDRQMTQSQLDSMSCAELDATYQHGIARVQNSDMPPERKRSLMQRGTTLYNLYKFRKGC